MVSPTGERLDPGDEISAAVQQIGLRIEKKNEPHAVLVVDHFEKPGPN